MTAPGADKRLRMALSALLAALKQPGVRPDMRFARERAAALCEAAGSPGNASQRPRPRKDPWREKRAAGRSRERKRIDFTVDRSSAPEVSAVQKPERPLRCVEHPEFYVMAVLETREGALARADREALAAARSLVGERGTGATLALFCGSPQALEDAGADRVARLPCQSAFDWLEYSASVAAQLLKERQFNAVVFPHTVDGRHAARFCAAQLGLDPVIGAHHLEPGRVVRRAMGGTRDAVYEQASVLTVGEGYVETRMRASFEARAMEQSLHEDVLLGSSAGFEDLGTAASTADDIPMEEAPLIFCAGAGVNEWDAFADIAEAFHAKRGGTRVVCDQGHLPRDRQVGASGTVVKANVYVALGLSGAVQHLQGIEDCEHVIAINTDSSAPIVDRADVSIIADVDGMMLSLRQDLQERAP